MRLSKWAAVVVALALLGAACGTADETAETTSVEDPSTSVEVPDTAPALSPGAVSAGGRDRWHLTELRGQRPRRLCRRGRCTSLVGVPWGLAEPRWGLAIMQGTYAAEAQRLGWVVVSPAAPDGVRFFDGSETLLPGFVDWIETWVVPEGGAPHVIGPSNGGISSFRYAIANPDRAQSVVVFPGFPRGDADRAALGNIADIPVRLYAGETDTQWVENGETTFATLTELGGDVELTVFDGEAHFPESTRNGVVLFEELESFR